jgi:hypothetical protein
MKTTRRQNLLAIARGPGVEPIRTSEPNRRTGNKKHMKTKNKLLHYGLSLLTAGAALFGALAPAQAADKKKRSGETTSTGSISAPTTTA